MRVDATQERNNETAAGASRPLMDIQVLREEVEGVRLAIARVEKRLDDMRQNATGRAFAVRGGSNLLSDLDRAYGHLALAHKELLLIERGDFLDENGGAA